MNALQKMPPAWHTEAVKLLTDNFTQIHAAFTDATKRAVWMGLFLNDIKARGKADGSIPHGQFGGWLERNVPDLSVSQVYTYMKLAAGVCDKGHFEIADFREFAQVPGQLPPKIEKMIEGKTQQQLFFEFKNVDEHGNPRKPGCSPGKARQLTAQEQAEKLKAMALENSGSLGSACQASNRDFFLCDDLEITAQIAELDLARKLRAAWLAMPKGKRDASIIEKMRKDVK